MKERSNKSKRLLLHSRENRNNLTKEERQLWLGYLRYLPYTVRKQHIIEKYIADFYIPTAKLVIELDGSQHSTEEAVEYDKIRDEFIEKHGIKVIRFSNQRINNEFKSVCAEIIKEIQSRISLLRAEGVPIEEFQSKSSD